MPDHHVRVRLFIGCLITSELKVLLEQSHQWKQASIAADNTILVQAYFRHRSYLGLYAEDQQLTLQEVRSLQKSIREQLTLYCPKMRGIDTLHLLIFPQVFVN